MATATSIAIKQAEHTERQASELCEIRAALAGIESALAKILEKLSMPEPAPARQARSAKSAEQDRIAHESTVSHSLPKTEAPKAPDKAKDSE